MREIINIGGTSAAKAPMLVIKDNVASAAASADGDGAMQEEPQYLKRIDLVDKSTFGTLYKYGPRRHAPAAPTDSVRHSHVLAKRARSLAPHCPPRPLARALARSMDAETAPAAMRATVITDSNKRVDVTIYGDMLLRDIASQAAAIYGADAGAPVALCVNDKLVDVGDNMAGDVIDASDTIIIQVTVDKVTVKGDPNVMGVQ